QNLKLVAKNPISFCHASAFFDQCGKCVGIDIANLPGPRQLTRVYHLIASGYQPDLDFPRNANGYDAQREQSTNFSGTDQTPFCLHKLSLSDILSHADDVLTICDCAKELNFRMQIGRA